MSKRDLKNTFNDPLFLKERFCDPPYPPCFKKATKKKEKVDEKEREN